MSTIGGGLLGRTLMAVNGEKIGRIDAIYVNSATGEPEWVAINLGGLIATKHGFAPVTEVTGQGDHAVVAYDRNHVRHGLNTKSEGVLSPAENQALYRHYGLDSPTDLSGSHDAAVKVTR